MKFNLLNSTKILPVIAGAIILTACGDDDETPPNPPPPPVNMAPTVEVSGDVSLDEKTNGSLSASATDSDGSISTYAWVQTGGTSVDLADTSASTLEFTAPVAKMEETLTFEVTVTDDDGATASDSIMVTVNPVNEIDFQIQGVVWNGVAVPSGIEVDFGGGPMSVSTDADGAYSVDIIADEDQAEQLLYMTSVSDDDPEIAFANLPVSLQDLMDKSGSDSILDSSEEIGVNLTPLSTSLYGLLFQQTDSVSTSEDVAAAMSKVVGSKSIGAGTAIKVISENNGAGTVQSLNLSLSLPDGYADTIEFALDPVGIQQYLSNLRISDPMGFDSAKGAMLNDPNIVSQSAPPFSNFPVTLTMVEAGFVAAQVTLNDGGTGSYSEGGAAMDAEWSQDADGVITISGVGGAVIRVSETFPVAEINGSFMQVRSLLILEDVILTPVVTLPTGTVYNQRNVITQTYPDNAADLPPVDRSTDFEVTYFEDSEYQDIDIEALFSGGTAVDLLTSYFQSEFNPNLSNMTNTGFGARQILYSADFMSMERVATNTNGTVTSTYGADWFSNGSWELTDPKTLTLSFDSSRFNAADSLDMIFQMVNDNITTLEVKQNGIVEGLSNGVFATVDATQAPTAEADAVGFYALPIGLFSGLISWTELKTDGTAEIVAVFDRDQDGVLEQSDTNIRPAFWELNTDGKVVVSEYRFQVTRAPGCNPDVDACNLSRQSSWIVANRDGADVFVMNELSISFPVASAPDQEEEVYFQTTSRAMNFTATAPVDISALPPG